MHFCAPCSILSYTFRFDLLLACAVSKRVWYQNDRLSVPVPFYAWHEGNLSETDFSVRVQASQRASLSVCGVLRLYSQFCVVSTRRLSEGIMADLRTVSQRVSNRIHSHVSRISVLVES